jgi:trigger factor
MQKKWASIIDEEKLDIVGRPQGEITKIAEGNDLEFKIMASVMPQAELPKDWRKTVSAVNKKQSGIKPEAKEDEVRKEIERIAQSRAKLVAVSRPSIMGDSVTVDFRVMRQGVPIENGTGTNHPLVLGSGVFIPGFEEAIVGMKEGESKDFELRFPEEYHEKALAGQPASFQVTLRSVQMREIPAIDDDFARSLGKFDGLAGLESSIREGMEEEARQKRKDEWRSAISESLASCVKVEVPEVMIHEELHQMMDDFEAKLRNMGVGIDEYLAQIKKTRETIENEWRPQAQKRILSGLAIAQVVKECEIDADAAEIETEMNKVLSRYKNLKSVEKDVDTQKLYSYSRNVVVSEKAFQYMESL